jgi:glycosyltransferase involved in cell wall biosynthesis
MSAKETHAAKVAVIMLTINQREKTLRALASFRAITTPPFHLLLWDNGSQDGTLEAVQEAFPEVVVHHHPMIHGHPVRADRDKLFPLVIEEPALLAFCVAGSHDDLETEVQRTPDDRRCRHLLSGVRGAKSMQSRSWSCAGPKRRSIAANRSACRRQLECAVSVLSAAGRNERTAPDDGP